MPPPSLQALHITKRFGAFTAVDDVSLDWTPGTFHALLGENGAGKSTLVKCLLGFHHADSGEVRVDRQAVRLGSPRDARKLGMGMVFQHFTLIPSMTVAENLVLASPDLPAVIDWKSERRKLREFLERAPFQVDLDAPVNTLAAGQKQKVEILKELYLETKLLILDEPTSVLTPTEADEVLGFLRRLADRQELSVLLITHKFREVMAYTDSVTVLRRGRYAGGGRTAALDSHRLAEMMMGESPEGRKARASDREPGEVLLQIRDLFAMGDNGVPALRGVNLTVRRGEIVGIAGVSGNGQRELVEVIAGQRSATTGSILVDGEVHQANRRLLRKHQFFVLPEEPLRNASVPAMSVAENMAFRVFDEPPFRSGGFLLSDGAFQTFARNLVERFSVRPPAPEKPIGELSGGNVQRAILARELSSGPVSVLVAANPCFGLDFKATDFIHDQLVEARNSGAAVLVVSEDLDELIEIADRIFVISEGALVHETTPAEANLASIGRQMAGRQ
jgi:simple sugar transport system ATP-binding protein